MDTEASKPTPPLTTVALVGNPNTGKTTLFNALTGLSLRVGNYPGVTVERKIGTLRLDGQTANLVDLPGTYSLAAHSPDEMIVADILLGRQNDEQPVDTVLAIVDASNLERNLYLVSQVLELGLSTVVALNMVDIAESRNIQIDAKELTNQLGVPVIPICASKNQGVDDLRHALSQTPGQKQKPANLPNFPDTLTNQVQNLAQCLHQNGKPTLSNTEVFRALIDEGGYAEQRLIEQQGPNFSQTINEARRQASPEDPLSTVESKARYDWIERVLTNCLDRPETFQGTQSDRIDRLLLHSILGTAAFIAVMATVFQAIFTWAGPLMDVIDEFFGSLGQGVGSFLPKGALQSLIVDGVIGGVGGVMIFLPQIAMLFFFLGILEDCGYMARAAVLMDRLLTRCGLSGKSFIPLLSSFACAVPGIMATRTIEDRRDRFTTILVAPLMSCSARLPVYTILIAAFIPDRGILGGWIGLQGLTMFALYSLGTIVAILIAWILKKTLLKGEAPPFVLELPSYKVPNARTVGLRVYMGAKTFLVDAGTIIMAVAVVMWATAYFPRPETLLATYSAEQVGLEQNLTGESLEEALTTLEGKKAGALLEQSFLGRAGHFIEPTVKPLGWDWRIGMAVIASFPAREIIVATLGTVYSLGEVDESSHSLQDALRSATWPDGRPIYSIPVALSIMVFFALCAQCMATLATIRKETGAWTWPALTFAYMTTLAYLGALITYHLTSALGWGA